MSTTTESRPVGRSLESQAWAALLAPPGSWRALGLALLTLGLMTLAALVMLVVATVTLFRARRLYTEVLARGLAHAILRLWRIDVVVHRDRPFPRRQTVYVSNHTSTIDLFVLVALGFPRTRFFLSGFLRKLWPLGVIATLMGTFFTCPQTDRPGRVRCFQRADRRLRRTGDSVYLSPEGQRVTTGRIGHFNKGAFHLATSLGAPIVPLYLEIPPGIDPGKGYAARPGTVHVHVGPEIPTGDWRLEDLEANRAGVRSLFVEFEDGLRSGRWTGPWRPVPPARG
jgi:1-acyl-sn-glycerol-3-phosphate acyltransferase